MNRYENEYVHDLPDVIRFDAFGRPMNPRGRTGAQHNICLYIYLYVFYIYTLK